MATGSNSIGGGYWGWLLRISRSDLGQVTMQYKNKEIYVQTIQT